MRRIVAVAAAVLLLASFAGFAAAGEKPGDRPGGSAVKAQSITATVESIDYKARTVTLTGPKGNKVTLTVGEEAKNFNQVRKGDKVTLDYYEFMAVDVQKAVGEPKAVESQTIKRAKPGQKPGGTIEKTSLITARVEKVDYDSRVVTFKMPDGTTKDFKVGEQVKRLREIVPGDEVVVQYTEAVAISVRKP